MSERIIITAPGEGVAVGGRFDGWRMRQHPDGQWMSVARLEAVDPFAKAEGVLGMLFAEHRAKSDATPTPAGAGDLVERAKATATSAAEAGDFEQVTRTIVLLRDLASRIEALEAEVDGWRKATWEAREGIVQRDERLPLLMNGWTARATSAEAERDALKAEVERGDVQRVRDLTKHIERADKAEEERDAWRERESETQEALQKIGEEFGVHGGEARTDGVRRILNKYRDALTEIAGAYTAHGYSDAMDAVQALKDTARDALK